MKFEENGISQIRPLTPGVSHGYPRLNPTVAIHGHASNKAPIWRTRRTDGKIASSELSLLHNAKIAGASNT